jgi:hypothetical protein
MTYTFTHAYYWQAGNSPIVAKGCSPTLEHLEAFLKVEYGGQPMGCFGVRAIRNGTAPSTHSWGAAFDWRWGNVGAGHREVGRALAEEVLDWLTVEALNIGIQQIHDYWGCRVWKVGRGWKTQEKNPKTAFGQGWAQYFHFEVHPDAYYDDRPITKRTITNPPKGNDTQYQPFPPPTIPGAPVPTVTVTVPSLEVLRRGSTGRDVTRLQCILRWSFGQESIVPDGNFGAVTEQAVRNVQAFCKLTVDGVVGKQTWTAVLDL